MAVSLRSALLTRLGFRHGFSLRTGGVSKPPFDQLNLARNLGDDPEAVRENHARFAGDVGYGVERLYELSQVHGAHVEIAEPSVPVSEFRGREGDAVVAVARDVAAGVRVADCVPILLADPRSGAVAAVHAGWKGTVAGVVSEAVRVLCERAGARPDELAAAIGPHISVDAFEVSAEVAHQIAASAPEDPNVIAWRDPRPHASLERAVRAQLVRTGLRTEQVERVAGCTFLERARFFSFRRDGSASGRHLAAIVAGC